MVHDRTTGNPLSAGSLALFMATSLPKESSGGEPQIKTAAEAIALAVHAGMLAVGFRLVGLGEDVRIEASADAENPKALPAAWNATSTYAFCYAHSQSAMEYLVKVNRMAGKAVVNALAIGGSKTSHFDVTMEDYLSQSALPLSVAEGASTEESAKLLQELFISPGRLNDLGSLLKISVIQKLAPSLQKEGYEEGDAERDPPTAASSTEARREEAPNRRQPRMEPEPEPARPYPLHDPLAARPQPGRPLPEPIPGFEDEYEVYGGRGGGRGGLRGGRFPVGIGHDDLYPAGLGPNDALYPHLAGGIRRPGGDREGGGGGGMHPTFDDPLFRGQGELDGFDAAAPPGARYDPVGPGDGLRDLRGGPRFPGGGGGGFGFGGLGREDFI